MCPKLPQHVQVSLDARLAALTSASPLVVFMKGNPGEPKCGFSRTLMGILQESKVPFTTFDILTDEEVGRTAPAPAPVHPTPHKGGHSIE